MANNEVDDKEIRIYGDSAVRSLYKKRKKDIIRLFVRDGEQGRYSEILSGLAKLKIMYRLVKNEELEKISQSTHHEGICAIVKPKSFLKLDQLIEKYLDNFNHDPLIILDNITNPHNIGAIVRSSAFFGNSFHIIHSKGAISLGGSLHRISEGGVEFSQFSRVVNITDLKNKLVKNKIKIIVADAEAETSEIDAELFQSPYAIVLGNENSGVSKELKQAADLIFKIEGVGQIQSLNVSVSAGIIFNNLHNLRIEANNR